MTLQALFFPNFLDLSDSHSFYYHVYVLTLCMWGSFAGGSFVIVLCACVIES